MKRIKLTLFLLIIEATILLLLTDYYVNPISVQPVCSSAAHSDTLGDGTVFDCVACYKPAKSALFSWPNQGEIDILIPETQQANVNWQESFDSYALAHPTPIQQQFRFVGNVYGQYSCQDYQCESLLIPQDFLMETIEHRTALSQLDMVKQEAVCFNISSASFKKELYSWQNPNKKFKIVVSGGTWKKPSDSFLVRFRYTTSNGVDNQTLPLLVFHQISNDIFIRVLLSVLVFLEIGVLLVLISHQHTVGKIGILLFLGVSFVCQHAMGLAGVVALYLIFSRIFEEKKEGIAAISAWIGLLAAVHLQYVNISWLALVNLLIICYVASLELKNKSNGSVYWLLFRLALNLLIAWYFSFSFLLLAFPLHLLGGLMILRSSDKEKKAQIYDLIHFNDEEEDVLSRIQRELQRK